MGLIMEGVQYSPPRATHLLEHPGLMQSLRQCCLAVLEPCYMAKWCVHLFRTLFKNPQ
jgi:hypothetical protein